MKTAATAARGCCNILLFVAAFFLGAKGNGQRAMGKGQWAIGKGQFNRQLAMVLQGKARWI